MLRFPDIRAFNIFWLVASGLDVGQVMERAGHAQMSTTQLYLDALKVDEAANAALDDLWDDGGSALTVVR